MLSFFGLAKTFLGDPKTLDIILKVLLGILVLVALAYHYFTVTSLEKNLAVAKANVIRIVQTNAINVDTIAKLQKENKHLKKYQKVITDSYIEEVNTYKKIIANSKKKVIYKDKIVIREKKVPVLVKGKTVYVNKCEPIRIHKLDSEDSNTSIQRILSTIGK